MRIVHVSDCYLPRLGGVEMHVHDLAVRQLEAGHEVDVITHTPSTAPASWPPEALPAGDEVRALRLGAGTTEPMLRAVRAGSEVADLLAPGRYDMVHAHGSVISPLAAAAARGAVRAGLPAAVTIHSLWTGMGPVPWAAVTWARLRALPLAWSAVSEIAAEQVRRTLGRSAYVSVVPNAVDLDAWPVLPHAPQPDRMAMVSVMRLAPRKRPLQLLRMLRRLRSRLGDSVDLTAVVVGEGPERARLERYLCQHRMQDMVSLPGILDRRGIRERFAAADVYVAPAERESFGIAALEARCAGLPVVASSRGGVGEFVTHGREGMLAASDADMVAALEWLACHPAERAAMAQHNRRTQAVHTWQLAEERTDSLYDRAAALAGVPARHRGSLTAARGAVRASA